MFCNKCGNKMNDNDKFCNNCGSPIDNLDNTVSNSSISMNLKKQKSSQKDNYGLISLILGIIAIVLVFIYPVFNILIAIIGLVFGIISKTKDIKKTIGIILNSISIAITIVLMIIGVFAIIFGLSDSGIINDLYNEFDNSNSNNYIAGTWNCKTMDGLGTADEYTVTMKLNKNNTFVFGAYGDLTNNHAGGTYTYEEEKEKNEDVNNKYKYFYLKLNGNANDYIIDGKNQNKAFNSEFEIGIQSSNTNKESVLINVNTYQMYYCKLEK